MDNIENQACFITTPERVNSSTGRFVSQFTGMGKLELTPTSLVFTYPTRASIDIEFDKITRIERGRFSRWTKPLGLDFLSVTYSDEEGENTICLTPVHSYWTPVWDANKLVTKWLNILQDVTDKSAHL